VCTRYIHVLIAPLQSLEVLNGKSEGKGVNRRLVVQKKKLVSWKVRSWSLGR
jgi:hypothetical protein